MSVVRALVEDALFTLELPAPEACVVGRVQWGHPDELFSAAYWRTRVWHRELQDTDPCFRLGRTLIEEIAVCLLGGFGMPAEVGLAAFERVRDSGFLTGPPWPTGDALVAVLREPIRVSGRLVRYRFPEQRGRLLARALECTTDKTMATSLPRQLRNLLTTLPGIGFKTASWITRNHCAADDVAILDVHVVRAGRLLGLWDRNVDVGRQYTVLEDLFLGFAAALGVRASVLDAVIWSDMRAVGPAARKSFDRLPAPKRRQAGDRPN